MPSIALLLGVDQPTEKANHLVRKMVFFRMAITAAFEISTTWFIIYVATSLGNGDYFEGLTLLAILVIIRSGIQTIVDYPTGTIGDRFGQRYILASGLICYSVAYWLISTISIGTRFAIFLVLYVLLAFGASLMSGALESWFDNNYRIAMPHDTDRKSYGVLLGRLGMIVKLSAILVIIPGAWLATSLSRIWVFQVQSILCLTLVILVLLFVRDFETTGIEYDNPPPDKKYTSLLIDGLKFLRSDSFITYTIVGEVLLNAVFFTFWMIVYYPFLFYFLLTDVAVSSYRTIGIFSAAVEQERSGIWSKRFHPVKWIPRFRLLSSLLFYLSFALTVFLFPAPLSSEPTLNLWLPFTELALIEIPLTSLTPVIFTLIVFTSTGFLSSFADILTQRIYIDIIPDEIRNSWYSLKPTMRTTFMLPLVLIAGWIIPEMGLSTVFLFFALIASLGVLLIYRGFSYQIPITTSENLNNEGSQNID